jgi:hypothetical protein
MIQYGWYGGLIVLLGLTAVMAHATPIGYQAVPRDAFPVFDHPDMLTAEAAERQEAIYPHDIVVGVHHGQEAKAYPITVMGTHELGNDTIDGIPIAVSW